MIEQEALLKELEAIHDGYKLDVRQFASFMRERKLSLSDALTEYVVWLDGEHGGKRYSPATYNRKISAVKHRIRFAFKKGSFAESLRSEYQLDEILNKIPLKRIEAVPIPSGKTLRIEEVYTLAKSTRDRTIGMMIRFLAGTGVRVSEMLAVKTTDLRPVSDQFIEIRVVGKGERERWINVKADFVQCIHNHFKGKTFLFEHDGRAYNRTSVPNRIKHESLRILGREVTAQQLRYTWARVQIGRGKSVRAISTVLGYADPGQTAKLYPETPLVPQEAFLDIAAEEGIGTDR